jgi:hypothetical protein
MTRLLWTEVGVFWQAGRLAELVALGETNFLEHVFLFNLDGYD